MLIKPLLFEKRDHFQKWQKWLFLIFCNNKFFFDYSYVKHIGNASVTCGIHIYLRCKVKASVVFYHHANHVLAMLGELLPIFTFGLVV